MAARKRTEVSVGTTAGGSIGGVHDPGTSAARERAEALPEDIAASPLVVAGHDLRLGTASWTDRTMTAAGVFYPEDASTPEDRLRYYASRFPTVEVDASYYALPARQTAELWAARTPPGFVFDIKAYALMTGHPTEVKRLPKALREALPPELASKTRLYAKDLPAEIHDEVWAIFRDAMQPLMDAGKMGAVLLQYPKWFGPSRANREAILEARSRLGEVPFAVELRNANWFSGGTAERTLQFLADHQLPFVMVDEPQGMPSSIPPMTAVTSPALAIIRMHGRRADFWEGGAPTVADKYRYLYDEEELSAWAKRVIDAARQARETRVVFNNCYGNYGTTNALEMAALLRAVVD
jgi:uncharacterized protein YecE (DUF72 family)